MVAKVGSFILIFKVRTRWLICKHGHEMQILEYIYLLLDLTLFKVHSRLFNPEVSHFQTFKLRGGSLPNSLTQMLVTSRYFNSGGSFPEEIVTHMCDNLQSVYFLQGRWLLHIGQSGALVTGCWSL